MFGRHEEGSEYRYSRGCRGCPALLPAEVAAAMTMVFLHGCSNSPKVMAFSENMAELSITKDMKLSKVLTQIRRVSSFCCSQLKSMTVFSIMLITSQDQN